MSEKTTVTNTAVSSESADKEKETKEIENRVRENLKAEFSRQSQELSEKLTEKDETIKQLEEKVNLSLAEQKKLNEAKSDKSDIEKDLQTLNTQPEYAALREKFVRETARVKTEAVDEAEHRLSVRLMEKIISNQAKKENIKPEDLRKELNQIRQGRWVDKLPDERVELAIAERERMKSESAKDEEIKQLKAQIEGFSESGVAVPRNPSVQALRGSDKTSDQVTHAKALGL